MCKKDWYVAYCDLLGVKEWIKDDCEALVKMLKDVYSGVLKDAEKYKGYQSPRWDVACRIFSDNIVIGVKCVDGQNKTILPLFILTLIRFQSKLFHDYGVALRGGMCRGQIFFDDTFVIGQALVDAYLLESREAVYPRIILSPQLASEARSYIDDGLITEGDGQVYVNYFIALKSVAKEKREDVQGLVDRAITITKADMTNPGVAQKYNWLKERLDEPLDYEEITIG